MGFEHIDILAAEAGIFAQLDVIGAGGTLMNNLYSEPWEDMSPSERANLANMVQGREMPFPLNPAAQLYAAPPAIDPLTLDELEAMSFWMLEGAPVNACK